MGQQNKTSLAARLQMARERYGDRIVGSALLLCLAVVIAGSVIPSVGDWLESIRFVGPGLLLAVALVLFDAVTRERKSAEDHTNLILPRPSALLPYMRKAASRRNLTVTFVGYSSETLYRLLSEVFAELGDRPHGLDSLHVRILIPDCSRPMTMPCLRDGLEDYPPYRAISKRRADEFCGKLRRAVEKLVESKKVAKGTCEIRTHRLTPLVKIYLLNEDAAFWGLYPVEESVFIEPDGRETAVLDLMGTRTPLLGAPATNGNRDLETIRALSTWVESIWLAAAEPEAR